MTRFAGPLFAIAAALAAGWAPGTWAHDFWVQPAAFGFVPGGDTSLTLQVGHGPQRQRSAIPLKRIVRFGAALPNGGWLDLKPGLTLASGPADGDIRLADSGTYVLALDTDDQALSFLPALRFNDYLKAEGLTPALDLRTRTHRLDTDATENYSRHAKVLIRVGSLSARASQVTRPLGMPLEIVPQVNPYATPRPTSLPILVVFENRPLAGALVKLTNLDHDEAPVETHVTDRTGRAIFAMPKGGKWLLNVIWTKPQPMTRDTDFETTFSSLTFGWP